MQRVQKGQTTTFRSPLQGLAVIHFVKAILDLAPVGSCCAS